MPIICMFLGVIIRMYYDDTEKHHTPHFHAQYAEFFAVFNFEGELLSGKFPIRQATFVKAWALLHTDELMANWQLASNNEEIFKISPTTIL